MKLATLLALVLALACSVAPATALTVDILLSEGNAKICIKGTADITEKPLTSASYRLLYLDYKLYKNELIELVEQGLESYLEEFLGRSVDVKVEHLELKVKDVYTDRTFYPSSVTAVVGELEQVDSTYRVVADAGPTGQVIVVEIVFDGVEAYGSAKLVLEVALSTHVDHAEVWVYNHATENWDVYPAPEMNSTAKTSVELVFSEMDMLDYVWGGKMRVRVYLDTLDGGINGGIDGGISPKLHLYFAPLELYLYSARLEAPVIQQTVFAESFCFTVEGVGEVGELGMSSYNLKIRYMSPTATLRSENVEVKLPLLLLNLSAFKVPLEEWRWSFNGTHTVFTLHVPEIVYEHATEKFTVDPIQKIVVRGYARAEGDKIHVVPPTLVGIAVAIATATLIAVLLALGKALKKQKQTIAEERRKYVKRKTTHRIF